MPASTETTQAGNKQCAPLMEVANPDLYRRNGFRVTGLTVDASAKEVSKRGDKLKMMEELGQGAGANTNAFPINPPPSVDDIREALQRLKDPEARIIDEVFWFWPETFGQSATDEAIQAYITGQGEKAFDLWTERKTDPQQASIAYHNLAVVNHLMAIEWSNHFIDSQVDEDTAMRIDAYWTTSIRYWRKLAQNDEIWDSVKERIRKLDDPRLTTGFARRMRDLFPQAIATINANLAYKLVERGRLSEAEGHKKYIEATGLPAPVQQEIYVEVLRPARERIEQAIKPVANGELDPKKRFEAARSLAIQVPPVAHLFGIFFVKGSHHRTELFDEAAVACANASSAYQKKTGDLEGFLHISRQALSFATSNEARKRVEENIEFGEYQLRQKSIEPFLKDLEDIGTSDDTPAVKLLHVKETIMPRVATLLLDEGPNSPLAHDIQSAVAVLLRRIALDAHNNHEDIVTSQAATKLAAKLAKDPELKKVLATDQKTLDKNEAEEASTRLDLRIRDDHVVINRKEVRYNQTVIPVSSIIGVKFGVYTHRTNGIQDNCSYIVAVGSDKGASIRIECKRFFRSETQAEADYQAILKSLFPNVIPPLAMRIARSAISTGFKIGESVLSADTMTLSSGMLMWQKEIPVPYSQIRWGYHQGNLTVVKDGDKSISRSFSVRETWNAVIFEQIVKAIQLVKTQR